MPSDAPPCISVGQKCKREGWGYYWAPFSDPVMIHPNGLCYRMETLPCDDDSNIYKISIDDFVALNKTVLSYTSGNQIGDAFPNVPNAGGDDAVSGKEAAMQSPPCRWQT